MNTTFDADTMIHLNTITHNHPEMAPILMLAVGGDLLKNNPKVLMVLTETDVDDILNSAYDTKRDCSMENRLWQVEEAIFLRNICM